MSFGAAALLGLGLGAKHALEPDHLAAVCTLVAKGGGPTRAARSGALWGVGHSLVIIVAGSALVFTGLEVPGRLAMALDIAVAVMLLGLGLASIFGRSRAHTHAHGGAPHTHERGEERAPTSMRRPLLVGLVHGASGTAALTLLVASTMQTRADGVVFITLFGLASILGMSVAAALLALPLGGVAQRSPSFARAVRAGAGVASIVAGLVVAYMTLFPSAAAA